MRSSLLRHILALGALLAAMPASALFHLWQIAELYSNADGSVQFIEFTALAPSQQFLAGHTLVSSANGVNKTYTFQTNLPGDTAGKTFLVGTEGYAALNGVTPDYVVPDGFLSTGGGVLSFAEASDLWVYPALPVNGTSSLARSGAQVLNSPKNFAGQTGTVTLPAAAPLNFQALWWRSPANSESGWGVNITHQGDILFATWFTYDTDGSQMWLVMSNGNRVSGDTFTGTLYRTTGPAFSTTPFNPAQVGVTAVGSATFAFTDADNGTFTYTVNGITQSKPITRQVYSSPLSNCVSGGSSTATPTFQDLWWASPANSESGWGVNLAHQGDILFATWFTYGDDGKGIWLVMSNGMRTAPNTYSGALYRTTGPPFNANPWNPAQVMVTQVGNATFTFTGPSAGTFAYTVGMVTQTKAITRQVYSTPTLCYPQ